MILYLGTYPLPQSDLIFRNGGSIIFFPRNEKCLIFQEVITNALSVSTGVGHTTINGVILGVSRIHFLFPSLLIRLL